MNEHKPGWVDPDAARLIKQAAFVVAVGAIAWVVVLIAYGLIEWR